MGEATFLISSGRGEAVLPHRAWGAPPVRATLPPSGNTRRGCCDLFLVFSFGFCYLLWYLLWILAFLSGSRRQRNPPQRLAIRGSSQKPSGGWVPPSPWFLLAGMPQTRGLSASWFVHMRGNLERVASIPESRSLESSDPA